MSQPAILETSRTIGDPDVVRWARWALIVGATIIVWAFLGTIVWLGVAHGDDVSLIGGDSPTPAAPATPAGDLVRDPDGQLCLRARLTSDGFCILP